MDSYGLIYVHQIYGFLDPHESARQTLSRSVQPCLDNLPLIHRHTCDICSNRPHRCTACGRCGPMWSDWLTWARKHLAASPVERGSVTEAACGRRRRAVTSTISTLTTSAARHWTTAPRRPLTPASVCHQPCSDVRRPQQKRKDKGKRVDLCSAELWNSSLKRSWWHVLKGSYNNLPAHGYPRMEWVILPLLPAAEHHRTLAGTHFPSHRG